MIEVKYVDDNDAANDLLGWCKENKKGVDCIYLQMPEQGAEIEIPMSDFRSFYLAVMKAGER